MIPSKNSKEVKNPLQLNAEQKESTSSSSSGFSLSGWLSEKLSFFGFSKSAGTGYADADVTTKAKQETDRSPCIDSSAHKTSYGAC